ncbi:hypothetical protein A4X03_0g9792 [Tilletia caries]|uniref:Uncharacterized protein n=1 Tax=Tilletia caries TaxID=13290 RepID=A0A8T8S9F1_9BASI|nr:hypothetical protein A4X03_0g9792 [Tilletia caries]
MSKAVGTRAVEAPVILDQANPHQARLSGCRRRTQRHIGFATGEVSQDIGRIHFKLHAGMSLLQALDQPRQDKGAKDFIGRKANGAGNLAGKAFDSP